KHSLLLVGLAENQVRKFVGGIHFERVTKLLDGTLVLPSHVQTPTQAEVNADRKRIQFARLVDLLEAVLKTPHRLQVERIPLVGSGVAGIQLNGTLKSFF